MGNLYIVATPIGNLEDITFRAVRVLAEVDFVYAEDTRTTGNLFKKYGITTRLNSYNAVNQDKRNLEIIDLLKDGRNIALVSDAGTPGVSDPGYSLVSVVRKLSITQNLQVNIVSIPGPSALTAFISILGLGTHVWTFYGFLPHKNGRQKILKEMLASKNSSVFYESTHRIEKCMKEISILQGSEGTKRQVAIGRELTKIYEEVLTGTPEQILAIFATFPEKKRGEFVVMIV